MGTLILIKYIRYRLYKPCLYNQISWPTPSRCRNSIPLNPGKMNGHAIIKNPLNADLNFRSTFSLLKPFL